MTNEERLYFEIIIIELQEIRNELRKLTKKEGENNGV